MESKPASDMSKEELEKMLAQRMKEATPLEIKTPAGIITGMSWNDPKGKPVMCHPGWTHNAHSFIHLSEFFSKEYYIISIDMPGHGHSFHLPCGYQYGLASAIHSMQYAIHELKLKDCIMVGHCLGAVYCLQFGMLYPELVESIILLDPVLYDGQGGLSKICKLPPDDKSDAFMYGHLLQYHCNRTKKVLTQGDTPFSGTKEECIAHIFSQKNFPMADTFARLCFDREHDYIGDGKYQLRQDMQVRVGMYDCSFLCTEAMLRNYLPKCSWNMLMTRTTKGGLEEMQDCVIPVFKDCLSDRFHIGYVDGSHNAHMDSAPETAERINDFLGKRYEKLNKKD